MGFVYLFKEFIGFDKMMRLCGRGGDVFFLFGVGVGVLWFVNNE